MKQLIERGCPSCGHRAYAPANCSCPTLAGTMCSVVTPLPGKRVSGVLCRDRDADGDICFFPGVALRDVKCNSPSGLWDAPIGVTLIQLWRVKKWIEQYGKLPRKGSKEMVLLELSNDRQD